MPGKILVFKDETRSDEKRSKKRKFNLAKTWLEQKKCMTLHHILEFQIKMSKSYYFEQNKNNDEIFD